MNDTATNPMQRTTAEHVLVAALLLLTGVYVVWFGTQASALAALVALAVFALPPACLAIARLRGSRTAGFWASVLALFWFSHGIMVAWTRPAERGFALAEVALSVVVILAASLPGMRARFAAKRLI